MKPLDDMLPVEREERYQELIRLLQQADQAAVAIPPSRQAQIIARVQERLLETGLEVTLNKERSVSHSTSDPSSSSHAEPAATLAPFQEQLTAENERTGLRHNGNIQPGEMLSSEIERDHPIYGSLPQALKGPAWQQRLALVAALLFLTLLIGSMVIVLNLARSSRSGTGHTQDTSSRYILLRDVLYKIDLISGTIIWSKHIPTTGYTGGTPAVGNGTVFISSSIREGTPASPSSGLPAVAYVFAYSARDGSLLWRSRIDSKVVTAPGVNSEPFDLGYATQPVLANGLLYVASRTGKVYALDAATGAKRWVYDMHIWPFLCADLHGNVDSNGPNCSPSDPNEPTVEHGVVYVSMRNQLFALNAATGSKLWTRILSVNQVFSQLVVSNGRIYETSFTYPQMFLSPSRPLDSYAYAYNAKTGEQLWITGKLPGSFTNPIIANGDVYLASITGSSDTLYAFNEQNGSPLWHKAFDTSIDNIPIVMDGVIYVETIKHGSSGGVGHVPVTVMLYALDASDGSVRWQHRIDRNGWAPDELFMSQGVIYALTAVCRDLMCNNASLFLDAYSADDGHKLLSKELLAQYRSMFTIGNQPNGSRQRRG
jgi:outer membrane protein assembly factor BamB